MKMTLREFTKSFAPLPYEYEPVWRLEFPHRLRERKGEVTVIKRWFRNPVILQDYHLEEKWERVHAGEVIDIEWRKVYQY